jgi:hypothetical protein
MLAMHDRHDIKDSQLIGMLPRIIQASNLDFDVRDEGLKAVLCLVGNLPKPRDPDTPGGTKGSINSFHSFPKPRNTKVVMPTSNVIGWLASE